MKKIIVRLLIALVVVVILAFVAVGLFLDKAIKTGVETIGPKVTKVDIRLQSVSLSLLSGGGTIKGLVVGNPAGFNSPSAINVGEATLALTPRSLLSDKIIIKTIRVQGPEITYETNLKDSNLSKIVANMQEVTGGGQKEPAKPQEPAQPKEAKPAKKLEVDEFIITGGKIHVSVTALNGGTATVPLPDIHLKDLGTGPDGITPEDLAIKVLGAIEQDTVKAAAGAVADIAKGAVYMAKDLANAGSNNAVQSVTKGIGNLLKKK
jgi:uncharacterized protein involved in outer membrane biogenesis